MSMTGVFIHVKAVLTAREVVKLDVFQGEIGTFWEVNWTTNEIYFDMTPKKHFLRHKSVSWIKKREDWPKSLSRGHIKRDEWVRKQTTPQAIAVKLFVRICQRNQFCQILFRAVKRTFKRLVPVANLHRLHLYNYIIIFEVRYRVAIRVPLMSWVHFVHIQPCSVLRLPPTEA